MNGHDCQSDSPAIGSWSLDAGGRRVFDVNVAACPRDAWHLVGAPGLLALSHTSGAISLYATGGGMVRLADRTGFVHVDGVRLTPTGVSFGPESCTWVFEHHFARIERTLRASQDRAELTLTWTLTATRPVTVTEAEIAEAMVLPFSRLEQVVEPNGATALAGLLVRRSREIDRLDALTGREREVSALMTQGLTNARFAGELFVCTKTGEGYVRCIFMKPDLPHGARDHRWVLVVLGFLRR